jgi:hypothetical protein
MPWGEGPGDLPPMRRTTGEALVRLAAEAVLVQLVGDDELEHGEAQAAWHHFADLMLDADCVASLDDAGKARLARNLDMTIGALRRAGATVRAGAGGGVLFVAVVPIGYRRDLRALFAAS